MIGKVAALNMLGIGGHLLEVEHKELPASFEVAELQDVVDGRFQAMQLR